MHTYAITSRRAVATEQRQGSEREKRERAHVDNAVIFEIKDEK